MTSIMLVFLNALLTLANAQENTKITVVLEKSEKIESVQADVVIQGGLLISSNCEQLGQVAGMPAYRLELKSVSGQYLCVPERDTKTISQKVDFDMGMALTVESIKNQITMYTDQINQAEGYKPSQPTAQCSIDASGNVIVDSCKCESEKNLFAFDIPSTSCKPIHQDIVSFFVSDCSSQMRGTLGFLENAGVEMISQYSGGIELAMCAKYRSKDYFIPGHELVYKIFFFLYVKHAISADLEKSHQFENIKLLVTQAEIENLKQWAVTYAQELSESPTLEAIIQNADSNVLGTVERLPEQFQYMQDYIVIE